MGRGPADDGVAPAQQPPVAAVDGEGGGPVVGHLHPHRLVGGHHQGPVEGHVGRHRGDDQGPQPGRHHRAPGRERVGGGPGGRGHDHAVGGVGGPRPVADGDGEVDGVARPRLLDHGVVEGEQLAHRRRAPPDLGRPASCAPRWWRRRRGSARGRGAVSSGSTWARKPRRPRLTPRTGTPRSPTMRTARRTVPSPPRATTRSAGSAKLLTRPPELVPAEDGGVVVGDDRQVAPLGQPRRRLAGVLGGWGRRGWATRTTVATQASAGWRRRRRRLGHDPVDVVLDIGASPGSAGLPRWARNSTLPSAPRRGETISPRRPAPVRRRRRRRPRAGPGPTPRGRG